jgi:hypothetical protein
MRNMGATTSQSFQRLFELSRKEVSVPQAKLSLFPKAKKARRHQPVTVSSPGTERVPVM